ncbi:MAG: Maf family protein [Acidobacteriota bacterium]
MLILASRSPRRAELLAAAGIPFEMAAADVDERVLPGESPERHVARLAAEKAAVVHARLGRGPVLGADTVVVVDDEILGKPVDASEAAAMLGRLSGRGHDVLTGVCLLAAGGERVAEVARTRVWFAPMTRAEIEAYVATGEPMDKAGAYAIQGLASRYVERIDGSYTNVVGLPVAVVYRLLR